jgi:iron complex outermembrane recepter protein
VSERWHSFGRGEWAKACCATLVWISEGVKNVKTTVKAHLLRSTLLAALSVASGAIGSAYAQQTVPTTTETGPEESGDVVVVTGSRIARQDFTAISPVTTVGAEDIELTATLSVEQLLNSLPQVIPGNTVTSNNAGGEDFATIDLRGLGPGRTLVLIDGERVPGGSTSGVVDINTIPAGLLERIEVVTGGASAVYGSDAISGVVNFILKKDFEGAELRSTASTSEGGKTDSFNVDALIGGNFDNGKGNITAYGSYFTRTGVFQSEYDYSRTSGSVVYDYDYGTGAYTYALVDSSQKWLDYVNGAPSGHLRGNAASGGSGTPPWGSISSNAANPFTNLSTLLPGQFAAANTDCNAATPGVAVNGGGLSFNDAGALTPFFGARACGVPDRAAGSSRYNFAPDNYIYLPSERFGLTTLGHYAINDDVTANFMLSYIRSQTQVQLAATPITGLSIPVSSPAISGADGILGNADDPHADLSTALTSRANPTANFTYAWRANGIGPRVGNFQNSSLTARASVNGHLAPGWEWNLAAGFGQVDFTQDLKNNVNSVALLQGVAGCANVAATVRLPNCVNVDIFGPNVTTPAMSSFIGTDIKAFGKFEQSIVSGYVRGDLFELPAGPVSTVFGVEYRGDDGEFLVDDAQKRGEIAGFNQQNSIVGDIDVYEAYGEVVVPILGKMPFVYDLSLEAGYRTSDYSTIGSVNSYKYGASYSPFSWLSLRSVYNKAVRAPSLQEVGQAGDQGFANYTDPCGPLGLQPATQAFCITQGVPAANFPGFVQTNSQVQAFAFGNPNLAPEEAETITAGIVFQPDFVPVGSFNMSLDYYDITLSQAIVPRGVGAILQGCYGVLGVGAQAAADCARITRDPATGQITAVNTSLGNGIADLQTKGVDVQIEYDFDLDELFAGVPGSINFDTLLSFVDSYDNFGQEIVGTNFSGIGGNVPDFKAVTTGQYEIGDYLFQLRHSFVPALTDGNFQNMETPEFSNYDLSARWNVTDALQLTAVIQNVTNEFPPQGPFGFVDQANTDAALYAPWAVGRVYSLSARLRF